MESCEIVLGLLSVGVLDLMDESVKVGVKAHLASCDSCMSNYLEGRYPDQRG